MAAMKRKGVRGGGGAGSIGSHVVDRLVARGDRVIVVDDFNDYYDPKIKWANVGGHEGKVNFRVIKLDIRDIKLWKILAKEKVEAVVHMAARAGIRPSLVEPELYWSVNVMGALNLLEGMRKCRVKQLVFASSSSVYGIRESGPFKETDNTDRQISPYGASKKAKEVLCATYAHLYGIKTTGLRFFTAYGPRNRPDMACYLFVEAISHDKPITVFGDGSSGRDYTYIEDIADGVVAAVDNPMVYEIINLGGSKPTRLSDLIETIEKAMGKRAVIEREAEKPGDVQMTYADTNKAQRLLRWRAKTDLERGIRQLVAWYEQEKR